MAKTRPLICQQCLGLVQIEINNHWSKLKAKPPTVVGGFALELRYNMPMLIETAYAAATGTKAAAEFVGQVNDIILFPLIILLTAIAFLIFLYGCFLYIANAENSAARETGRSHIIWGIVGLFVMLSAFAILSIAANTFGLGDELQCVDDPGAPGCEDGAFEFPSAKK